MIKALFTALTGIDEDIDSDDSQASWERQKYLDDNDLDNFDFDSDTGDEPENVKPWLGWFGL